ncbi:MAG: hypothetical protein ACTHKG_13975 [Nocardioides sp.]
MGSEQLDLGVVVLAYVAATWAAFRLPVGPDGRWVAPLRLRPRPGRGLAGLLRRRRPEPLGRPLEEIAADARRLAPRALHPPRGTSRAKVVALCYAYDHVLSEACAALGVEHLLSVLEPGDERDLERRRVQDLLWLAGLRIDDEPRWLDDAA